MLLTSRKTNVAAALIALVIVSMMVVRTSAAAFTATTDNEPNNWAAGTVVLSDDAESAMFDATDMTPGDTVERCIAVTYSGSITPATVKLYGTVGGSGLAQYLDLTIERGTGGSSESCSGFSGSSVYSGTLAGFSSSHSNWGNGAGTWSAASNPSSQTYRFELTLQDDNDAQGKNANATFTWEAQNS